MRDTSQYTNIYTTKYREIMVLKEGGSYSFLQADASQDDETVKSYMEVIVPAEQLEDALFKLPTSEDPTIIERMQLLFGSMDGTDHFVTYCDENGIETQTLFWD